MTNDEHLRLYQTGVRELCELVIEVMDKERAVLLSPVIRGTIKREAERVLQKHRDLAGYLRVDSPTNIDEVILFRRGERKDGEVCPDCGHSLKDNQHGPDQNDFDHTGKHLGYCTYCRYCRQDGEAGG
jgi:hypothetical protein